MLGIFAWLWDVIAGLRSRRRGQIQWLPTLIPRPVLPVPGPAELVELLELESEAAILIASRNGSSTLAATIESARGQGDIYVVSDASTDDTALLAQRLGAQALPRTGSTSCWCGADRAPSMS